MPTDTSFAWLARVCNAAGEPKGTGFVVTENQVLTCAHVINLEGIITVQFLSYGDDLFEAEVKEGHWHPAAQGDLALLTIKNPPDGLRAVIFAQNIPQEAEFESWGYPANAGFALRRTEGKVCLLTNSDTDYDLQLDEPLIVTHGFSGAPVFDKTWGSVIGLVVAFDPADEHGRSPHSSLGISISKVFKSYPRLRPSLRLPQDIQEDYRAVTLASSVYVTVDDYLEESFRDSFGKRLQEVEACLENESRVRTASLQSWDDGLSSDLREALSEVAVRCGLPRWWNVDVIEYLAQYADIRIAQQARSQARKLFRWLSTSPLIPNGMIRKSDNPRPSFMPQLRSGTDKYLKTQSVRTWRELHNGLSVFWKGLSPDYGFESRMNAIYHQTCAQPLESLQDVLVETCQLLLSATNDNHAEISSYLAGICVVLRDVSCLINVPQLRIWHDCFEDVSMRWRNLALPDGDTELLYAPELLDSFWIPLTHSEHFQASIVVTKRNETEEAEFLASQSPALKNAKDVLAILESQVAAYTSITAPAHLLIELVSKREEVFKLEKDLIVNAPTVEELEIRKPLFDEQLRRRIWRHIGELSKSIGRLEDAAFAFGHSGDSAETFIQLGHIRLFTIKQAEEADKQDTKAEYQEAEKLFQKALDLAPDNEEAQLWLIKVQSQYDQAKAEETIERVPRHYRIKKAFVLERANIKRRLGKIEEAREDYRKAIELGVEVDEAWAVYLSWLETSEQSECHSDIVTASTWLIAQANDREPQLHTWYDMRSQAYRNLGDEESAERDRAFAEALPSEGDMIDG